MYKDKKGTPERNKFWSKESFLSDLEKIGNIRGTCRIYEDENKGVQAYEGDVRRWRRDDSVFDEKVIAILSVSETTSIAGPGREPKDGGDKSWQEEYCLALYKFDGNRKLAAEATPYSFGQIMDMLNPETVSYDKEFHEKTKVVEASIAAEVEGLLLSLRKDDAYKDFNTSKITQTKAWYALKLLEKLDRMRYGRYVEMQMKGTMKHEHTVELIPREQKMFTLWEDQRKFLDVKRKALMEGVIPTDQVIEGELVESSPD